MLLIFLVLIRILYYAFVLLMMYASNARKFCSLPDLLAVPFPLHNYKREVIAAGTSEALHMSAVIRKGS